MQQDFLINTDYPLDKVVFMISGSITVSTGGYQNISIPHNLGFIPLAKGNWTTMSDWSIVYEEHIGPLASPNSYSPFMYDFSVTSDNTNINIAITNYLSGAPVTIYYRVYCLEPSTSLSEVPATSSDGSDFLLSSDSNYTKLVSAGYYDFPDTIAGISSYSINHNLGIIPQVIYWIERSGACSQVTQSYYVSGITCQPTTNQVIMTSQGSLAGRVHWRVYADD